VIRGLCRFRRTQMAYNMQPPAILFAKAREACFQIGSRDNAPVTAVCFALTLAVLTLAYRIAAVW
jgi:hypothetical protein